MYELNEEEAKQLDYFRYMRHLSERRKDDQIVINEWTRKINLLLCDVQERLKNESERVY